MVNRIDTEIGPVDAEAAPSFLSLLETHARLDELFLQHQEALLRLDMADARERLAAFEQALRPHMRAEEEFLLPVYRRAGSIPGGPIEFFTGEHKRMLEFLERFEKTLQQLEHHPPDRTRRVIKLFDEQAMFKHLVEHHDRREQTILYPTLDKVTDAQERRDLLRRMHFLEGINPGTAVP